MTTKVWQPGDLFVWLAVGLPLVTWLPLVSHDPSVSVTSNPLFVWVIGGIAGLGLLLAVRDWWLGLWVAWTALTQMWTGTIHGFEEIELTAFGAWALVMVREMNTEKHTLIIRLLLVGAAVQVVYGFGQMVGYDPLWMGLAHFEGATAAQGSLGNPNYYGVYLAMLIPLAPLWLAVLLFAGLLSSKCALGLIAACVGLAVQHRHQIGRAVLLVAILASGWVLVGKDWYSARHRMDVWTLALQDTQGWQWLIGHGPGSWIERIPQLQVNAKVWAHSLFAQAHNDPLQLLYTGGAISVVLLALWFWSHRAMFTGRYGGAVAAVLVGAGGIFTFRLAIPAATAIVLLGLATSKEGLRHDAMA